MIAVLFLLLLLLVMFRTKSEGTQCIEALFGGVAFLIILVLES